MQRLICRSTCGLGAILLVIALALKNLFLQVLLLIGLCLAFYAVIRFLRWLLRQVAPILRVLIVLIIIGGSIAMIWNDLQSLGGEKLFVLSILCFIVCGVLCAPGASRARA